MPHRENSESKHLMTVGVEMSEQGIAKGNREYSSMTVSIYLLRETDGKGPLKSRLNRSIGLVALIRVAPARLKNRGLSPAQILQFAQVRLTSSVENGKFFVLTKCNRRVTPG